VKEFRFWRDPLFVGGCCAYALNRWWVAPRVTSAFLRFHFNDLFLIPCALPILLWMQERLGLRRKGEWPQTREIVLYWAIWSILFEVIGPHLIRRATGDMWDVAAYAVGGLAAALWWNRPVTNEL
jgi:hypothetical protein